MTEQHFTVMVNIKQVFNKTGMVKGDRHVEDVVSLTVRGATESDAINKAIRFLNAQMESFDTPMPAPVVYPQPDMTARRYPNEGPFPRD